MTITIKDRGLENLAKHQYQYQDNTDALLALAELWGYDVDRAHYAICFRDLFDVRQFLEDIEDMEKCTTRGVVYCDWCKQFKASEDTWHLDAMMIEQCSPYHSIIDHVCSDCAHEMTAFDFISQVLGW